MFTVLVCRSCCCGRASKHPEIDHDWQLRVLSEAIDGQRGARLRRVGCLDVCSQSNVIVVRDRRPEVAANERTQWFGGINTTELTEVFCAWLHVGGPSEPTPEILRRHRFAGPSFDVPADLRDEDCDRRKYLPIAGS